MPSLVVDIKQLRRRKVPVTVTPAPEPVVRPTRSTPLVAALERMSEKNPVLGKLLAAFDLEPQSVDLPAGHERLWFLAGEALIGGRTYTKAEAIEQIRVQTKVTADRAERGFAMMVEALAIEPTVNPDLFYLGGTTPF